jgi:hypothetical protein
MTSALISLSFHKVITSHWERWNRRGAEASSVRQPVIDVMVGRFISTPRQIMLPHSLLRYICDSLEYRSLISGNHNEAFRRSPLLGGFAFETLTSRWRSDCKNGYHGGCVENHGISRGYQSTNVVKWEANNVIWGLFYIGWVLFLFWDSQSYFM